MNHCLVFDIGKTNKKTFVFDEDYRVVFEKSVRLPETVDDDGDACEDIALLRQWVLETAAEIRSNPEFQIAAVNCATYGASFVHVDAGMQPVAPLYNYLKPFPQDLMQWFLNQYGGAEKLSLETASPLLGNLNSGLQLLYLKYHKPQIFNKIRYSLHLPNWIAHLLGGSVASEITSVGCHTMLWDFRKNDYHEWVGVEGMDQKFPPLLQETQNPDPASGIGLHDSSSALIPYLASFQEPFLLLSTGTWCIALNPFNSEPLTSEELKQDCLCYLTYEGKPVKSARYFGGYEHDEGVKKIAKDYGLDESFYRQRPPGSSFMDYQDALDAYESFMKKLMAKQAASIQLALGNSPVRRIFVDGGFSHNRMYMRLLKESFPEMEVLAAEAPQATALGAAVIMHGVWNGKSILQNLIKTSV